MAICFCSFFCQNVSKYTIIFNLLAPPWRRCPATLRAYASWIVFNRRAFVTYLYEINNVIMRIKLYNMLGDTVSLSALPYTICFVIPSGAYTDKFKGFSTLHRFMMIRTELFVYLSSLRNIVFHEHKNRHSYWNF